MGSVERFPLRPRRPWAVWLMLPFGVALVLLPLAYRVEGTPRLVDMVAGGAVVLFVAIYLASPTWRSAVVTNDEGIAIEGPRGRALFLRWDEIIEVVVDEGEQAALVRGPESKRSFLLPSGAHPAPYQVKDAGRLYARIVSAVPAAKLRHAKEFT